MPRHRDPPLVYQFAWPPCGKTGNSAGNRGLRHGKGMSRADGHDRRGDGGRLARRSRRATWIGPSRRTGWSSTQDPAVAQAWYMVGAVGQVRGRPEEAVASYREAIRLVPDFPEACNNLGVALHALQRSEEAIDALRRALALAPDYAEAHNNLGNAPARTGRLRRGRGLLPAGAGAQARLCRGPAQPRQRPASPRDSMAEALAATTGPWRSGPTCAQVHLSRALAWLEMGDFERGWPEYEWRLKCPQFAIPRFPPAALGRAPARRPDDPALCRSRARRRDPVHPVCPDGPGPGRPGGRRLPCRRWPGCWRPARAWTWSSSRARRSRIATSTPR